MREGVKKSHQMRGYCWWRMGAYLLDESQPNKFQQSRRNYAELAAIHRGCQTGSFKEPGEAFSQCVPALEPIGRDFGCLVKREHQGDTRLSRKLDQRSICGLSGYIELYLLLKILWGGLYL